MVKGGLRERWTSLGHTVLYGSYAQRNDMFDDRSRDWLAFDRDNWRCRCRHSTETREWSLGAVQEIDAAAMSLWVQYDHFDADGFWLHDGCSST